MAARRSWGPSWRRRRRRGGGEDPWLCVSGFRPICLYRKIYIARIAHGGNCGICLLPAYSGPAALSLLTENYTERRGFVLAPLDYVISLLLIYGCLRHAFAAEVPSGYNAPSGHKAAPTSSFFIRKLRKSALAAGSKPKTRSVFSTQVVAPRAGPPAGRRCGTISSSGRPPRGRPRLLRGGARAASRHGGRGPAYA